MKHTTRRANIAAVFIALSTLRSQNDLCIILTRSSRTHTQTVHVMERQSGGWLDSGRAAVAAAGLV